MPILHHPVPYEVLQRRLDNTALVEVSGECEPTSRRIRVEVSAAGKIKNTTPPKGPWYIEVQPDGTYKGAIPIPGGWYHLTVTELNGMDREVSTGGMGPFGVGEVFIVWGHSIAAGNEDGFEGAKDPRVTAPSDQNDEADEKRLKFRFHPLSDGKKMGPFLSSPSQWGRLGDLLTKRLNVPVAFYGAAFGGSNIEQNYKALTKQPFEHSFIRYDLGMPYQPVRAAMNTYAKRTGVRAVLTQHAVNDRGRPEEEYYKEFKFVMEHTRKESGMPRLPFVLVNDEFPDASFQPQRNALQRLFKLPDVYKGFDFKRVVDTTAGREDRIHLRTRDDFTLYATLMNEALSDEFFRKATPYTPTLQLPLAATE